MEALVPIFLVLIVVAIIGCVVVLPPVLRRRAKNELVEFARQRGWTYQESDTGFADRFGSNLPFRGGPNRQVWHLITGTYRGRPFCCFEYRTPSGGSDDTDQVAHYRVFAVSTPAHRPTLQVKRIGRLASGMLDAVGAHDLEVGDPEFDRRFQVIAEDERFARDVLTLDASRWLLQDRRVQDLPFRFERNELLTWHSGELDPSSIEPALDYLCDVLDRVTQSVWH